jgi:hypothetical protein
VPVIVCAMSSMCTRKKGEHEGLGRKSWRLTGERGGHRRRDVDGERRERARETSDFVKEE